MHLLLDYSSKQLKKSTLILITRILITRIKMKKIALSLTVATITLLANEATNKTLILTASQSKLPLHATTSSISIVTADEIKEKGYRTLGEALQYQNGISVTTNGGEGTVTSVFMRGMGTDKILVLLDGIPLNNPSSTDGQAFLEHIALDNVERIEILKGGGGAIWGADAVAGVVHIITKGAKNSAEGELSFGIGSYGLKKGALHLSYRKDGVSATLGASELKNDGFSAKAPATAETDGYENKTINFNLGYTIDLQHSLLLSHYRIDATGEYDGSFSPLGAEDPFANATTKQSNSVLTYRYKMDDFSLRTTLSKSDSERIDLSDSNFGISKLLYDTKITRANLIATWQKESYHATLGVEKTKTEALYRYNTSAPTSSDLDSKALFAHLSYKPTDNTLLEAALRRDWHNLFDDTLIYKLGARFDATDALSLQANIYKNSDTPNSYQLFAPFSGNANLIPATAKGFDIGLRYDHFTLTYFDSKISDPLLFDMTSFRYINGASDEEYAGVEASYKGTLGDFTLALNYTHLIKAKNANGDDQPKRAKDTLSVDLGTYLQNGAYLSFDALYVGDRKESGKQTGKYALFNTHYSYSVEDLFDLRIHAKNIFDKAYQTTYGYSAPGREIIVELSKSF